MFAVAHAGNFCLQAVLRWRPEVRARAVVLGDAEGFVRECTRAAVVAGVEPGLKVVQALGRIPGLEIVGRSPEMEQVLRDVMLETALRYAAIVEETAPGVVTLDLRRMRSGRAWHDVGGDIRSGMSEVGVETGVALAANASVAQLAARVTEGVSVVRDGAEFLRALPVGLFDPTLAPVLDLWGVRTVGEFLDLPREGVIERLGRPARELREQLTGRRRTPLVPARRPEVFAESCEWDHVVDTVEPVFFVLRRFLDLLSTRLRGAGLVATRLHLRLPLEGGGAHERDFTLPEPSSEAQTMFRILETHLETLQLPSPLLGVRLTIDPAKPHARQEALFGVVLRDPNRFGETLARLKALVGEDRAGFPERLDCHRPDAFRLRETPGEKTPQPAAKGALGLPLRRFRPAPAAKVRLEDDRPAEIHSPPASGRIPAALGPYRLSGHWWEETAWETEEWDVEVEGSGFFRLACHRDLWRVEGCYDDAVC